MRPDRCLAGGRGDSLFKIMTFLGNKMTWHIHIWNAGPVGVGMSNFDVDANPKISISIPVDLQKKPDGMAKIMDLRSNFFL